MPAINFKKEFSDKIISGQKKQTIRKQRKNCFLPDKPLYLYTGLRTKSCKKLLETKCISVKKIEISDKVKVDNIELSKEQSLKLALDDGFNNLHEFKEFFRKQYTLPFIGVLITWI